MHVPAGTQSSPAAFLAAQPSGRNLAQADPEGPCDEQYSEDHKGNKQDNAFKVEPDV
jgi:hypothetical protein